MSSFNGNSLPSAVQWLINPTLWKPGDQSRQPLQELAVEDVNERAHENHVENEEVEDQREEEVQEEEKENAEPRLYESLFRDITDVNDDVFAYAFDAELHGNSLTNSGVLPESQITDNQTNQDPQANPEHAPITLSSHQHDDRVPTQSKGKQRMVFPDNAEYQFQPFAEDDWGSFPQEDFEPYRMVDGVPYAPDQTIPQEDEEFAGPSNRRTSLPETHGNPYYPQDQSSNPQVFDWFNESLPSHLDFGNFAASQSSKQHAAAEEKKQAAPSGVGRTVKKGIDKRDQGEIRIVKGQLQQREGPEHEWGAAVRIEDIRDDLIAISRLWGAYNIQPEGGYDNNITCFCPGQENWAPDRDHRPPILFRFRKEKVQPTKQPRPWHHKGMRVISPDNHHMTYFHDCPMTISSEVHGFRLEAWRRLNPGLTNTDLLYRIPPKYREKTRGSLKVVDRYGLTGLTNKIWRWRPGAFVIPWEKRGSGGHVLRKFLLGKMDEKAKRENSTRHLHDLTRDELQEFKMRLEANKEKQRGIKKLKRERERRRKAGEQIESDPELDRDSETEPEEADDGQDNGFDYTEALGQAQHGQSGMYGVSISRHTSGPVSGKRRREHDDIEDRVSDNFQPAKRRSLAKLPAKPRQVSGNSHTEGNLSAQLVRGTDGNAALREPNHYSLKASERGVQQQKVQGSDPVLTQHAGNGRVDADDVVKPSQHSMDEEQLRLLDFLCTDFDVYHNPASEPTWESQQHASPSEFPQSQPGQGLEMFTDELFPWSTSFNTQSALPQEGHEAVPDNENAAFVHPASVLSNSTTSHLGKRRRDDPQEHHAGEDDLPTAKRHLQSIYIPGAPRLGQRPRKPASTTKPVVSRSTRPGPPPRLSAPQHESAIETIMNFDPYTGSKFSGDQTNNGMVSATYANPSGQNVAKPTGKIHAFPDMPQPQHDNRVPAQWASLPGFNDPDIFRPVEDFTGSLGLDQRIDDNAWEIPNAPLADEETPITRAHNALQQALFEDEMPVGASATSMRDTQDNQQFREPSPPLLLDWPSEQQNDLHSQAPGEPAQQPSDRTSEQPDYSFPDLGICESQSAAEPPSTVRNTDTPLEPETSTGSVSQPPTEMLRHYYRNKRPETQADQQQIGHAMNHSRIYYIRALGRLPDVVVPTSYSFAEQYEGLAAVYREHCRTNVNLDPTLHEVTGDWSKGFHDWECDWEILGGRFGECRVCKNK